MPKRSESHAREVMSMDLQQLEYFRAIARLEHVTRAAEELSMTQPALSRALARLEEELGVPLFERVGRTVRLTRYGTAFLRRVERALGELQEGRRELADLAGGERGAIALGFLRSLGAELVPRLVKRFAALHPDVQFVFSQSDRPGLVRQLHAGEIDLCITSAPPPPRVAWRALFDQEMLLIVARRHRFAHRTSVRLRELADERFVTFKPGHALRELTEELCQRAGFAPTIGFEGDESSSVRGFVAAGFGVGIVPAGGSNAGLVSLRITEPVAWRTIGIAWLTGRYLSAAERAFRAFVVEHAAAG
jgi:DNA-binding transcriptional LysR family regulator